METSVLYYGERGIVNSIVDALKKSEKNVKEFIDDINWLNNSNKLHLDKIETISFLIEGTFGQWGDPDLMIIINKTYVFIIEAKAGCFVRNACINKGEFAYTTDNSSKINIQLGLRKRFIDLWENKRDTDVIKEGAASDLDEAYKKSNGRALKKEKALELLENFFTESFSKDKVYYIALVGGAGNLDCIHNIFPSEIVIGDDSTGTTGDFYKHCGVIEYNSLEFLNNDETYAQARKTMDEPKCTGCIYRN